MLGDPVNFVDPWGNIAIADDIVIGGIIIGGAILTYAINNNIDIGNALVNWWEMASPSKSLPWNGTPNSTDRCRREDGSPKQKRRYGPEGTPLQDIDYDHDHGAGTPHVHDWNGRKRLPGRIPNENDGDLDFDAD